MCEQGNDFGRQLVGQLAPVVICEEHQIEVLRPLCSQRLLDLEHEHADAPGYVGFRLSL